MAINKRTFRYRELDGVKSVLISDNRPIKDDKGIRICVTGGRTYKNSELIHNTLLNLNDALPIIEIGVGCAAGVDSIVNKWAIDNDIPWKCYTADWERYERKAGVFRNDIMLRDFLPDLLLVFHGGVGTTNCAQQARKMGIEREFIDDDSINQMTIWG